MTTWGWSMEASETSVAGIWRMMQALRPAIWVHRITLAGRIRLPKPWMQCTVPYRHPGGGYLVYNLGEVNGGPRNLGCGAVQDVSGLQACDMGPPYHSCRPDKAAEALDAMYGTAPAPGIGADKLDHWRVQLTRAQPRLRGYGGCYSPPGLRYWSTVSLVHAG